MLRLTRRRFRPPDLRAKGALRYVGRRYQRHDNGEWYLKAGADSPENLLVSTKNLFSERFRSVSLVFPLVRDASAHTCHLLATPQAV